MTGGGKTAVALPPELESGLSRKHLPSLDGFRAVAVFLVIFYHSGFLFAPGGMGVLFFFVLSGFLITWLMLSEQERHGSVSLRRFYARRALRIFPAFYFYVFFNILYVLLRGKTVHWPQAFAVLFYVNNYYQGIHGDPNTGLSHAWSLAVEEQFYLLWPVTFVVLGHNLPRLAKAIGIAIVAIWIYRLILAPHIYEGYMYEAFEMRADSLLTGCLLAIALRQRLWNGLFRALCATPWLALITVSLLCLSVCAANTWGTDYRDRYGFAADSVLAATLLVQAIAFRDVFLFRWLDWRWVRYLGGVSYSLYLWQQMAIHMTDRVLSHFGRAISVAGGIGACIVVASLSWRFIEKPALRLKERFQV